MTDQRIFISPANDFKKGFDIITLGEIKTIKFQTGWTASGVITLHDGKVFNYSKLNAGLKVEFIYALQKIDKSDFFTEQYENIAEGPENNSMPIASSKVLINGGLSLVGIAGGCLKSC